MSRLLLLALVILSTLASVDAAAQDTTRPLAAELTRRGRIMAGGRASGVWSNDTPGVFGSYATWSVRVEPSLTYFVRDHLGVGVAASVGWSKRDLFPRGELTARDFALGFEFVWSAALAPRWRLLLRPFVGYGRQWSRATSLAVQVPNSFGSTFVADVENAMNYMRFAASLPFVYALTEGIGLGLGPDFLFDVLFRRSSEVTLYQGPGAGSLGSPPTTTRTQLGLSVAFYASF